MTVQGPNGQDAGRINVAGDQQQTREVQAGALVLVERGDTLSELVRKAGYPAELRQAAIAWIVEQNDNVPEANKIFAGTHIMLPTVEQARTRATGVIELPEIVVTAERPRIEPIPLPIRMELQPPNLRLPVPTYVCHPDVGRAIEQGKDFLVRNLVSGLHQPGDPAHDKLLGATAEQKAQLLRILLKGSTTGRDEQAILKILEQAKAVGDLDAVLAALVALEPGEDHAPGRWLGQLLSDVNGDDRAQLLTLLAESTGADNAAMVAAAILNTNGNDAERLAAVRTLLDRASEGGTLNRMLDQMKEIRLPRRDGIDALSSLRGFGSTDERIIELVLPYLSLGWMAEMLERNAPLEVTELHESRLLGQVPGTAINIYEEKVTLPEVGASTIYRLSESIEGGTRDVRVPHLHAGLQSLLPTEVEE